jgi:ubiquinone/menaquinone biosynthesis C-methylase UbiE
MKEKSNTSWEESSSWYDTAVGQTGHYYHEHVIFPNLLKRLNLKPGDRLLDLACGQGVLARHLPKGVSYVGVDISPSLIRDAQKRSPHKFHVGDITKPMKFEKFTHATIILALQNVDDGKAAIANAANALEPGGKLAIVLNHPCFRIPRQSSWGIDEPKKLQYRRIDRYLKPLKIPIQTHPGKGEKSVETWSFHSALSTYSDWLSSSGLAIQHLDELSSDKKSTGAKASQENRAREEFPLFLNIVVLKILL